MYKKMLITILSILCLCSNGVYAEDIIEQQTEPVIDNVETVEEIPSDNITETENTDVVEDTTTDTNNDREDVIEDGSDVDNAITDATQGEIEEPKIDDVTSDESNFSETETTYKDEILDEHFFVDTVKNDGVSLYGNSDLRTNQKYKIITGKSQFKKTDPLSSDPDVFKLVEDGQITNYWTASVYVMNCQCPHEQNVYLWTSSDGVNYTLIKKITVNKAAETVNIELGNYDDWNKYLKITQDKKCWLYVSVEISVSWREETNEKVSYEWSVPPEIAFTKNSNADTQYGEVSVNSNTKMMITLASDNDFTLTSKEGTKKHYKVFNQENIELQPYYDVVKLYTGENNKSNTLRFELQPSEIDYAGDYEGTLSFITELPNNRSQVLDVNVWVDDTPYFGGVSSVCFDIYINGILCAEKNDDANVYLEPGVEYEIKNIRISDDRYKFIGAYTNKATSPKPFDLKGKMPDAWGVTSMDLVFVSK